MGYVSPVVDGKVEMQCVAVGGGDGSVMQKRCKKMDRYRVYLVESYNNKWSTTLLAFCSIILLVCKLQLRPIWVSVPIVGRRRPAGY